jgi:hypothetical protein
MNLLEQCKEIILHSENGYYDKISNMQIATAAPAICRAVLAAMDEIDAASEKTVEAITLSTYSDDWRNGLATAYKNSANILRKHLEGEKETNKPILGVDISDWQTKENLPKPTTQVEEIVWHKYPEEKPKKIGTYLRTIMAVKRNSYVLTDWCKWLSGGWYGKYSTFHAPARQRCIAILMAMEEK